MNTTAKPLLMLLPGLACDGGLFEWQRLLLEVTHRVLLSDAHTRAAALPEMAALAWADAGGAAAAEPVVLVGASMGGMLALEMARQAPQRVRGIALLGCSARPDTPELIALRSQAIELFAAGRIDEVLQANIAFAFHPLHARDAELVARYLAMVHRAGAEQLIRQNRAVMARADLRPLLPTLAMPALVLCGEADQLTPPEHALELARGLPNARLEMLPGAGHLLTMEQPQRVNMLLASWLAELPR